MQPLASFEARYLGREEDICLKAPLTSEHNDIPINRRLDIRIISQVLLGVVPTSDS